MKLHVITICHMEPETIAWSLYKFRRTTEKLPDTWTMLDNLWPIKTEQTSKMLFHLHYQIPWKTEVRMLKAVKNLGGHGGISYCLTEYPPDNDDLVLIYDPDSNPKTDGWLEAMLATMNADPTLGYVSLLDNRNTDRPWTYEEIGGNKVAFLPHPEMFNVTLFRATVLKKGFLADSDKWNAPFYGHVETAFFKHVRELGMRNGYMFDYREDKCPIPHPKVYDKWKEDHALGRYPGNFDAYCIEKGIK